MRSVPPASGDGPSEPLGDVTADEIGNLVPLVLDGQQAHTIAEYVNRRPRRTAVPPAGGTPTDADVEKILEDVFRHLREPCTLEDAREARTVVTHYLNEIKKARVRALRSVTAPTPGEER